MQITLLYVKVPCRTRTLRIWWWYSVYYIVDDDDEGIYRIFHSYFHLYLVDIVVYKSK